MFPELSVLVLTRAYESTTHPPKQQLDQLASDLELTTCQVRRWFGKKREKERSASSPADRAALRALRDAKALEKATEKEAARADLVRRRRARDAKALEKEAARADLVRRRQATMAAGVLAQEADDAARATRRREKAAEEEAKKGAADAARLEEAAAAARGSSVLLDKLVTRRVAAPIELSATRPVTLTALADAVEVPTAATRKAVHEVHAVCISSRGVPLCVLQ